MRQVFRLQVASNNTVRHETLVAESRAEAIERITEAGGRVIESRLDLNATVSLLTSRELDGREMAQFFFTLSRRVRSGMEMTRAVRESAEFSRNIAVKVALSTVASGVDRGQQLHSAMREAGLPRRDWSIVQALAGSGRLPEALDGLGRDYNRQSGLRKKLRSLAYEPISFLVVVYIMAYGGIIWLVPKVEHFYAELNTVKMPSDVRTIYNFVDFFNAHLVLCTALYIGLAIGLILFVRSSYARQLLDLVPTFRALSERADHAALWSVFSMLYESAVRHDDAARMTGATAWRDDSRESFTYLAQRLQAGNELSVAVTEVGFPDWVRSATANAFSVQAADDIVDSLRMFVDNLASDVETLTDQVSVLVRAAFAVIMAFAVLGLAVVTVMPLIESALSAA